MSFIRRHAVSVTTDASGDATAYTDEINGFLSQIRYVKTSFDNGVVFTITSEATGETLWSETAVNASTSRAPRQDTHSTAGVVLSYAAAGEPVDSLIAVTGRIKIVVASGGNAKTGTFHFMIG